MTTNNISKTTSEAFTLGRSGTGRPGVAINNSNQLFSSDSEGNILPFGTNELSVGGLTIEDTDPRFGLTATGLDSSFTLNIPNSPVGTDPLSVVVQNGEMLFVPPTVSPPAGDVICIIFAASNLTNTETLYTVPVNSVIDFIHINQTGFPPTGELYIKADSVPNANAYVNASDFDIPQNSSFYKYLDRPRVNAGTSIELVATGVNIQGVVYISIRPITIESVQS